MKRLIESEVYIDQHGMAHDDEGNTWRAPERAQGVYKGTSARLRTQRTRRRPGANRDRLDALYTALYYEPKNRVLTYAARALAKGGDINAKEAKQIRDIMKKVGMKREAKLFEDKEAKVIKMEKVTEGGMSGILRKLEELVERKVKMGG